MSEQVTEGFDDFEKLLVQMGEDFGYRETTRNVLTKSAKIAMEFIVPVAKQLARSNTGKMRESIRVDARIPNANDKKSAYYRQGDAVVAVVSAKQSKVSLGEEFGTADKAGHPFLRPALEGNQEYVLRRLEASLAYTLNAYRSRKMKGK